MAGAYSPFAQQFDPAEVVTVDGPRAHTGRIAAGRAGERLVLPRIDGDEAVDAAPVADEVAAPPEPPEAPAPGITEEELEAARTAAREEAYREAEAATRAALTASIEQRTAAALEAIARALAESQAAYAAQVAGCARQSRDLGLALGRAIVPRALAHAPLADIEAMLLELVPRLKAQPRLELRLAPDLVEAGRAALMRVADTADYRGSIEVAADPALADGDARLAWHQGVAERSLARIEAEATALIEVCLPGDEPDAGPLVAGQAAHTPAHGAAEAGATREETSDEQPV